MLKKTKYLFLFCLLISFCASCSDKNTSRDDKIIKNTTSTLKKKNKKENLTETNNNTVYQEESDFVQKEETNSAELVENAEQSSNFVNNDNPENLLPTEEELEKSKNSENLEKEEEKNGTITF